MRPLAMWILSVMSSSNLDLVRSLYEAWELGDWSSIEWADPEIEFVIADGPDPSSRSGRAAMAEAWRGLLGAWEGYQAEAQEFRELDSERVYVTIKVSGRGRASGLQLEKPTANVFTIREGKVRRLAIYWDSENALAELAPGSK
jgi:ketosteroid isomerase-like protein